MGTRIVKKYVKEYIFCFLLLELLLILVFSVLDLILFYIFRYVLVGAHVTHLLPRAGKGTAADWADHTGHVEISEWLRRQPAGSGIGQ